ncbi:MAG: alkaline phosphatase D family protein [Bacteroidota bacterium]
MIKYSLIAALLLLSPHPGTLAQSTEKNITRIAFGSCSRQDDPDQMWNDVMKLKPALWIWAGDNIYGDTHDMELLKKKYDQQKAHSQYQELLATCPVTGTWDDHDYGTNDGGKYFTKKNESKKLMLEFLGIPVQDPVWRHDGIYTTYSLGTKNRKVKIINLDTRSFRDTITRHYYVDSASKQRMYRNVPNLQGDVLGETQWAWLENELKTSDAKVNIINSSIQVLSEEHRFEKWGNFPSARKRLLQLIATSKIKGIVIIISGDRHIAEISKIELPNLPYPLIDFTSSGLTHTWDQYWQESNRYRQGDLIVQKNFGIIEIAWGNKNPLIKFQVRGKSDKIYLEKEIQY